MLKTKMPLIMSESINNNHFFWLGGGHRDLKIRVSVDEFKAKWDQPLFILDF